MGTIKKKRLIVFLSLLLIGAAALFFHMYTSSQDSVSGAMYTSSQDSSSSTMYTSSQNAVSGADALSEEEAWKNAMAERLASSIKSLENVEDVSVNTEAEPVEVDITMSDTTPLSSDAREGIGRLADAMLPDAAVDFMEPDSKK